MVGSSKKTKTKNMAGSSKKTKIMKMAGSSKQDTNLVAEPDTDAKFNRFLDKNKEVVVGYFCPAYDFSNDVEKLMDGLAEEWKGIKFAKVSTASNRALVELAPVGTFPTFVYMKDGCEQDRLPIVDTVPLFSAKYPIPIAVPAMHAKLAVEKWLKEVTDGEQGP